MLAPSTEQAATPRSCATALSDDADADRWQMTLASDPIRDALQLADATREGAHPTESLGQKVEAIVNRPDVIDRLRDAFPRSPLFVRAFMRIRRVCDGAAVLDAAVNRPSELTNSASAQRSSRRCRVATAVDALADLHVAEAVLGVVKGRTATAAAATTAAGGQAPPPDFDVVRTPRSGRIVNTVALVVLPNARRPAAPSRAPSRSPTPPSPPTSTAARGAASASWTWKKLDPAGTPSATATLADVGLRPCDTVGLGLGSCGSSSARRAAPPRSAPTTRRATPSCARSPRRSPAYRRSQGRRRAPGPGRRRRARAALHARAHAAGAAAGDARAAAAPAQTENARRKALARMARWGITPLAEGGTVASSDLVRAAEVLERRIAEAPATLEGATVEVIAGAIGALVSPEGPLPVFGRLRAATFAGLRAEPPARGREATARPRLAGDGGSGAAAPRAARGRPARAAARKRRRAAARMDEPARRPLADRPAAALRHRSRPRHPPHRRVRAAQRAPTTAGREHHGTVAVAVIDRFGETVPDPEHISSVAFSHDLPPARAPQAVVLAVPPVVDEELTPAVLVDIVADVRALARTDGRRCAAGRRRGGASPRVAAGGWANGVALGGAR